MKLPTERLAESVASLRIATDESPYLDAAFARRFATAIASLGEDPSLRVVIVEGGATYFCAGASRDSLLQAAQEDRITSYTAEVTRALISLPIPSIAAMSGHAIGGGFVFGLWCDLVILAEESLYNANFMTMGFTPGMGATVVLEEYLGAPLARDLLFTGRTLKGGEIKMAGVPISPSILNKGMVREKALSIAAELASMPRESLVLLKKTLTHSRRERLESALARENENHEQLFSNAATRHRIAQMYGGMDRGSRDKES